MHFQLDKSIALLERTPNVYKTLLDGLGDWNTINEGGDTWAAWDIVGHFIFGEQTDWIPRMKLMLESEEVPTFQPYDRFAQKALFVNKHVEELLIEFETIRKKNITILKSWCLSESDLMTQGIHPDLGPVTLKQLIATWTIHDMGHLNQLSRVMIKHYAQDVGPWKAYSKILKDGGDYSL